MESYIFEGVVTALTSISHNGGQSHGINSKLRREKFMLPDGSAEEIPVISGNGLRGLLRDRGMLHMCRALGYGVDGDSGVVRGLSLPAFYFLFSGGALTSDAGRGLDVDRARSLRALIPLVGVFGGALGNMIMPGKVKIHKMIPICTETAHLLPEKFGPNGRSQSIWEHLQEEMYTRKDDEKNEHFRQLVEPEARKLLETKARVKKAKQEEGKPQSDTGQHQQMMYYVETFAAGTEFYWKIVLDDVTDVEFESFLVTLAEFSKRPYVGGKSAVGLGEVAVRFENWLRIDSRLQSETTAVDVPVGTKYATHLRDRAADIRSALDEIG